MGAMRQEGRWKLSQGRGAGREKEEVRVWGTG